MQPPVRVPCGAPCSELFFDRLLQDLDAKHRLRVHLLQFRVLLLKGLEALRLGFVHLPVLLAPAVQGGQRDLFLPAERLLVLAACFTFPEEHDDLLRSSSFLFAHVFRVLV